MTMGSITSASGYLPRLRMSRKAMTRELAWANLPLSSAGWRATADWDEDALTMAVEAARGVAGTPPTALRFASISAYFTDRAQAGIVLDSLALPRTVRTSDHANSRRAGSTALLDALLHGDDELIVAADKRPTLSGSAAQLLFGDGAAAVRTGSGPGARLVGYHSVSHDFIDRYTSRERPTPYLYEERFVRDIAVREMILPAVRAACESAGIDPGDIALVACAEPVRGCWREVAKALAIQVENQGDRLNEQAGDLGVAQPFFALGMALAVARQGDHVLMVGFGSGVDALIFRIEAPVCGRESFERALASGLEMDSVTRFLKLTDTLDLDWGMRAETTQKAQATVLERLGRDMIGFIGGRDSQGNVQFPKSAYPVNPALEHPEVLQDVRLADLEAKIVSVAADRLNFTPDPPFDFGLVQFDNGARVLMEMVNRPAAGFSVGDRVAMRLRIKSLNPALGFRNYFWKAAPVSHRAGEHDNG